MIFLRPNLSPSIPKASIKLANVRAYAPTTHCSAETPPCRSDWMLASATLTTVLSRKVRNSTVHRQARARGRGRGGGMPSLSCASVSATALAPADSGQLGAPLGVLQVGQPAEARDGYLPDAVLVDRGADLALQQRRAEQQDLVVNAGLRRCRDRDQRDRRGRPRRGLAERGLGLGLADRGHLRPVLHQGEPARD